MSLSLASGRDATELFELHHQFSDRAAIEKVLQKYEVDEHLHIKSNIVFDWKKTLESEFTKEMKEIAKSILGSDIKASLSRWLEYSFLLALLLSQWYFFLRGQWVTVISFPISLWIFSVNVFHDATHFAISRRFWRINSLLTNTGFMLATPYHWYHQHTVGHHSFPNVMGRDPDLYHVPDNIRHSDDIPISIVHTMQHWTFFFVSTFGIPGYYLFGGAFQGLFGIPYNNVVPLSFTWYLNPLDMPIRLLGYLVLMHVVPVIAHGLTLKGAIFAIVPEFIFTACFTICSQVNHLTPECSHQFNSNFFIHQIITSHNINTDDYFTTLFTGGLNMQIEHHLFPSVNHCHLHRLVPHIKTLCKKHNVHYPESPSIWEALKKHVEHLYIMGPEAYKAISKKRIEETSIVRDTTTIINIQQ